MEQAELWQPVRDGDAMDHSHDQCRCYGHKTIDETVHHIEPSLHLIQEFHLALERLQVIG